MWVEGLAHSCCWEVLTEELQQAFVLSRTVGMCVLAGWAPSCRPCKLLQQLSILLWCCCGLLHASLPFSFLEGRRKA